MFGENVSILEGLVITVVAMSIVLLVLFILSGSIDLLRVSLHRSAAGEKSNVANRKKTVAPVPNAQPAIAPAAAAQTAGNSSELIAAISAALAAATGQPAGDFVVKSVTPVPQKTPVWNMVSRQEQIHARLTNR